MHRAEGARMTSEVGNATVAGHVHHTIKDVTGKLLRANLIWVEVGEERVAFTFMVVWG